MSGLILIVEDEPDLVAPLEYQLQAAGYQTRTALTGAAALERARLDPVPDLVLLDLMLPDIQGTDVCRILKSDPKTSHMFVVMVSALGDEIDRVVGFELGADDYVVKPYSVRELILRVGAILNRTQQTPSLPQNIVFGSLTLDQTGHRVWVDGCEADLTALEFKLLVTFLERAGRALTRDYLLDNVWGYADVTTRTVDTHVKRLRQKIGSAGVYIETMRGVGYRFRSRPTDM
ncbi:MAG: two-component system phosphate regulon response regulator PhoB [Bradymonadia bacterium]|jgi:two-component system phosphate regulon response regulator PhoB